MKIIPTASFLIGFGLFLFAANAAIFVGVDWLADRIGIGLTTVVFLAVVGFIGSRAKETDGLDNTEERF